LRHVKLGCVSLSYVKLSFWHQFTLELFPVFPVSVCQVVQPLGAFSLRQLSLAVVDVAGNYDGVQKLSLAVSHGSLCIGWRKRAGRTVPVG